MFQNIVENSRKQECLKIPKFNIIFQDAQEYFKKLHIFSTTFKKYMC